PAAWAKTSCGPETSSTSTSGKATMATRHASRSAGRVRRRTSGKTRARGIVSGAGRGVLRPLELHRLAHELHHVRGRLARRARVERWRGIVLDGELDAPREVVAADAGDESERHVDTGRDAGRGDDLPLLDHALRHRLGAEVAQALD